MFGKRHAKIIRETTVSPIRNGDQMFWVEGVAYVPVVYAVTLPAPSAEAACRLAADMVRQAPEIGVPEYSQRTEMRVRDIRIFPTGEPSRRVMVPESFALKY